MKAMPPLTKWFCDKCGRLTSAKNGYVEWSDTGEIIRDFRIVHEDNACSYYHNSPDKADTALKEFLGVNGLQYFLSKLDFGPIVTSPEDTSDFRVGDMRNFVDTFRRLQLPHYEEARRYFKVAKSDSIMEDHDEVSIFYPETCLKIIDRYK